MAAPMVSVAQSPVVLKMQGAWGAKDIFNEMAEEYVKRVNEMAGGRVRIDYLVAGAVVKPFEVMDATSKGVLDACHGVPVYWYGKSKVASLFGSGPINGCDAPQTLAWIYRGGGLELYNVEGWRLLTDPTFDPPGGHYKFGWGTASDKLAGPAVAAADIGPIDAVLLSHDHHDDNLDAAGRELLATAGTVVTTVAGAGRLGGGCGGAGRVRHHHARAGGKTRHHGDRHAVPARPTAEQADRGSGHRVRAGLGGPGERPAVDLRRHGALRRREDRGRAPGRGHCVRAPGRCALPRLVRHADRRRGGRAVRAAEAGAR